jgi:hypothetical protein
MISDGPIVAAAVASTSMCLANIDIDQNTTIVTKTIVATAANPANTVLRVGLFCSRHRAGASLAIGTMLIVFISYLFVFKAKRLAERCYRLISALGTLVDVTAQRPAVGVVIGNPENIADSVSTFSVAVAVRSVASTTPRPSAVSLQF